MNLPTLKFNVFFVSIVLIVSGIQTKNVGKTSKYKFPPKFQFGVATSSYQIEGGWNDDGKGENIWDHVVHTQTEKVLDHSTGDIACDSYHKVDEDVQLLKHLGVNFYRFSLSWSRVLPKVFDNKLNPAGVAYYDKLINKLLENGIEPMVSLFHWDTPQVLQEAGGWLNPLTIDYYLKFADHMFNKFGDRVKTWATFNEPINTCDGGHDVGVMAPRLKLGGIGGYLCTRHVLLAHAKAYRLYAEKYRPKYKGRVGITLDLQWFQPIDETHKEAAERARQFYMGRFAHPIFTKAGDFPEVVKSQVEMISLHQGFEQSRLPEFSKDEIDLIRGTSDFFGLNHYTAILTQELKTIPTIPASALDMMVEISRDSSWEQANSTWLYVTPWGFRKVLNWVSNEYGPNLEIIVTENGRPSPNVADDHDRIAYLNGYFDELLKAIYEDNVNVTGYALWSFLDNFEWMDGYTERFGIISVDFQDPNRTRKPKLSAVMYKTLMKTRAIDYDAKYNLADFYK